MGMGCGCALRTGCNEQMIYATAAAPSRAGVGANANTLAQLTCSDNHSRFVKPREAVGAAPVPSTRTTR